MKNEYSIPAPPGVVPPRSLREARRKLKRCRDDMKAIEMQLADPHVTTKEGRRLSGKEWEEWRSRALHALSRKQVEYSFFEDWLSETRIRLRALEVGIANANDPNAHLVTSLKLLRSIRKSEALPKELHEKTGRVADAVESYLNHNAEVA